MQWRGTIYLWALLFFLGLVVSGCEGRAWQEVRKKQTVQALEDYLARYPSGKHAPRARELLVRARFRQAMNQNSAEAVRDFLLLYPDSEFADRAKNQLLKLIQARVNRLSVSEIEKARVVVKTDLGQFVIRLRPDKAPAHSRNLLTLATFGFYDGTKINIVEKGKMVHLGDPRGDGMGGPGYVIPFEPNDLKHVRSAVSMWRTPVDPNTAGSQFFICLDSRPEFDGFFTVFGEVVEGMEVVDKISEVPSTGPSGRPPFRPLNPIIVQKVEVEGLTILQPPSQEILAKLPQNKPAPEERGK